MTLIARAIGGRIEPLEKKLVLYGNGTHTRVVYGYLHDAPELSGFIVDDHVLDRQPQIGDFPVVPMSEAIRRFPPDEYAMLVTVGFGDLNGLRMRKAQELRELGYQLASYLDYTVRLPRTFAIEENCLIIDHVTINENVTIHEGAFISNGAMLGHDGVIGRYAWIGSGVAIAGGVTIGEASFLGMNCSVKQNTTIGHHTLVLPNTFVNADTKPYEAIATEPGKPLPFDSRRLLKMADLRR